MIDLLIVGGIVIVLIPMAGAGLIARHGQGLGVVFHPSVDELRANPESHITLRDRRNGGETRIRVEPRGDRMQIAVDAPLHVQVVVPGMKEAARVTS